MTRMTCECTNCTSSTSLAVFLGMERSAVNRQLTTTVRAICVGVPVLVVAARAAMSQAVVWHSWAREQTLSAFLPVEITSAIEHSMFHKLVWRRYCRIVY